MDDQEAERLLLELIAKHTHTIKIHGKNKLRSDLTKRGLQTELRILKAKNPFMYGRDKMMKIFFSLVQKGFVKILIDGQEFESKDLKSINGKKWEIVVSTLSEALIHNLNAARFLISSFHNKAKVMEKIKKFEPKNFLEYAEFKQNVLLYPFTIYLQDKLDYYVMDQIFSHISLQTKQIIKTFVKIEQKQRLHYEKFDKIISDWQSIGDLNRDKIFWEHLSGHDLIARTNRDKISDRLQILEGTLLGNLQE